MGDCRQKSFGSRMATVQRQNALRWLLSNLPDTDWLCHGALAITGESSHARMPGSSDTLLSDQHLSVTRAL